MWLAYFHGHGGRAFQCLGEIAYTLIVVDYIPTTPVVKPRPRAIDYVAFEKPGVVSPRVFGCLFPRLTLIYAANYSSFSESLSSFRVINEMRGICQ